MKPLFFPSLLTVAFLFFSCHSSGDKDSQRSFPLVIAHRGGADLAPENTLAAFRNAIHLGADMVEIDVHLTRDGHVVVIHDNTVDRTTDGHGRIADLTFHEIRSLDAGEKFDPRFAGEKVPTLEETLETLRGKAGLLLEIKKDHDTLYPGLEEKVVRILQEHHAGKWTTVQSFNLHTVQKVQRLDPSLRTFYLLGRNFKTFYDSVARQVQEGHPASPSFTGVAPHHSLLDAGKVDTLHKAGYQVYTWTVDDPREMQRILSLHVEGIITNVPDKLIAMLKEEKEKE